jgi:dUTP pyrophosphatase
MDTSCFHFIKTHPDAQPPKKAYPSDVGFDLYLVEKIKETDGVIMYDTGIAVKPPSGYYFEVVGRSSISKSGYMLANNIGIIDPHYRDSLRVALIKVNPSAPELQLPCRLVQLIPRQLVDMSPVQVDALDETDRGKGGFGSTGTS